MIKWKRRKLKALLALVSSICVLGVASPALARTIWIGEFQNCGQDPICSTATPPDVINVDMYDGPVWTVPVNVRCANLGGSLGWLNGYGYVCYEVDY